MVLIIPLKPAVLVLSLLTVFAFLGFVGSSLLEGKKPFVTRGEARQMLVGQDQLRNTSVRFKYLQREPSRTFPDRREEDSRPRMASSVVLEK